MSVIKKNTARDGRLRCVGGHRFSKRRASSIKTMTRKNNRDSRCKSYVDTAVEVIEDRWEGIYPTVMAKGGTAPTRRNFTKTARSGSCFPELRVPVAARAAAA